MSADLQRFDPTAAFFVFVAADKDAIGDKPEKCYFFKETGKGEKVIPAPPQALKKVVPMVRLTANFVIRLDTDQEVIRLESSKVYL